MVVTSTGIHQMVGLLLMSNINQLKRHKNAPSEVKAMFQCHGCCIPNIHGNLCVESLSSFILFLSFSLFSLSVPLCISFSPSCSSHQLFHNLNSSTAVSSDMRITTCAECASLCIHKRMMLLVEVTTASRELRRK